MTEGPHSLPGARWIVLTPSVDDDAWRRAIAHAAEAAGLEAILSPLPDSSRFGEAGLVFVTDDADVALAARPAAVTAIVPEPETAPDAVALRHSLSAPADMLHASLLLARAIALAPGHRVVTAAELGVHPAMVQVFDDLAVIPPRSAAEVTRRPAVAAALRLYRDDGTIPAVAVRWSEQLFQYDEKASRAPGGAGQLDITGRPRILVYGPYLALPPGKWGIQVELAVDPSAARHELRLDWGTPTEFISTTLRCNQGGVYGVEMEHSWSLAGPAELRLLLMEGAFDGMVKFFGATLIRLG